MGEHDFRVNIDKAQRDEVLDWLDTEIDYGCQLPDDIRILKSLKAMVENYPNQVKQYQIQNQSEYMFINSSSPEDTAIDVERWLKELRIPVEPFDTTEKQVEDSGDVRHEQKAVTDEWVYESAKEMREAFLNGEFDWLYADFKRKLKELGIKVTDKEG